MPGGAGRRSHRLASAAASRPWPTRSPRSAPTSPTPTPSRTRSPRRHEPGHAGIRRAFGPDYFLPDGTLDRARLRERVFGDAAARAQLEAILHPLIRAAAAREVAAWTGPYGLLVVPLLFERGGHKDLVQRVLVVDCPEETQVQRVMARSGLTAAAVRAIMATQLPRAERLARADDVLDNAGPPAAIAPQVAVLDRRYRALAAAWQPTRPAYNVAPLGAECRTRPNATAARLPVIRYEHPLNERIRTLMRLEDLYQRAQYFAGETHAQDHHAALVALFEITDVAARADLKTDILQELERQKQLLDPAAHESRDRAARARAAAGRDRQGRRAICSRRRARSAGTCARTSG